tara:strand:- start:121 stop:378 length:258 start_codon:yes stop_codon:yes gene_type:complete
MTDLKVDEDFKATALKEKEEMESKLAKDDDDKIWLELTEVEKFLSHVSGTLHTLAVNITNSLEQLKAEIEQNDNKGESNDGNNEE